MNERRLTDLRSVGPAAVQDLALLGITRVDQLCGQSPEALYASLCERTGAVHDICVLDVFACAVAQAENPALPAEQCNWFWWSKRRKASGR